MTPKHYLMQYQTVKYEYEEARKAYLALRLDAESVPGLRYDKEKIMSSNGMDLSDTIIALMKAEGLMQRKQKEYLEKLMEIREVIDAVKDDRYRELLKRRYIDAQSFEQISDEMGYEPGTIYNYHGWALLEIHIPQK